MQLHWIEICLVDRRPSWGNSGLSSFLEALLNFKIENHSWAWKVETEESEKRTVVGGIRGCRRKVIEEEEGKGFVNVVSKATILHSNKQPGELSSVAAGRGCFNFQL
jgi:hypothetical protein